MESVSCVYTVEYLPAVKDNEMLTYATTSMDLDKIVLTEVSWEQKCKCHMSSLSSETARVGPGRGQSTQKRPPPSLITRVSCPGDIVDGDNQPLKAAYELLSAKVFK